MDTKLPAVVLAGAPADQEIAQKFSINWRAELPVAGKPMVQYIIDALKASSYVSDIHVIGNIQCDGVSGIIPPAGNMIDNLMAGMKLYKDADYILLTTSDIPMVTSEALDDFIEKCKNRDADFYYPIISREDSLRRFPGMRRTYAKLAEGTFTGGNIFIISPKFMLDNAGLINNVLKARKNIFKLANIIGIGFLFRAVIAQTLYVKALKLADLEKTVGRILNGKVKAVRTPYAEIGADIDDPEQLEAMERLLASEGELK